MLLKANSLIYSIYICLIVAIFCGGLLYYFSLYERLDNFYESQQVLILKNRSLVNYLLGSDFRKTEEANNTTVSSFQKKQIGAITCLLTKVFNEKDTVSDCNFIGISQQNTGIFVPNFSREVNYSGKVNIFGNAFLPGASLDFFSTNEAVNKLEISGKLFISDESLPSITEFKNKMNKWFESLVNFEEVKLEPDTLLTNSFFEKTKIFKTKNSNLNDVNIKGNFVIKNIDSLVISKNCFLEDVILISPVIRIKDGFKGTIQAFGTKKIIIESNCELKYPSLIGLDNATSEDSKIFVGEKSKIKGMVINYGNDLKTITEHEIIINKDVKIYGVIYNTGKTMLGGQIYGKTYSNRLFFKGNGAYHENLMQNVEMRNGDYIPNLIEIEQSKAQLKYVCIKKNF
jgi:hypothetical protein